MNASDHELFERFLKTGDQSPFEVLVRRHIGLVYSAAIRITRRPVLAEEVSQIVFTKLARLPSLKPGLPLVAWLHRTTRTTAIDLVRTEIRRSRREEIAATLVMNEPSIPWERISPVLDQVIDRLPADDRQLVLCRFFERQPHAEIARSMGISEDALRMRVKRALDKLRVLLQRRGVTTTASALALALPAHALVTNIPAGLAATVAANAVVHSAQSLILIKLGIITMTKKSAVTLAAVLLLIGAGTAVFIATRSADSAVAALANGSPAAKPSGDESIVSGTSKSGEKPSRKREISEAENALVAKYGEARVKQARRITPALLRLIGEDGIQKATSMLSAKDKADDMKFLTTTFELTEEEQTAVAAVYDKAQARWRQAYQSDAAFLNSNPTALMERILAGDARKRGEISQGEYDGIVAGLDPRVTGIGGLMEWRVGNQDLRSLMGEEEFVKGLKGALDDEWAAYVDESTASWAAEITEARKPGEETQISLAPDRQQTLEELDESVAGMTKMLDGARAMFDGMQSLLETKEGAGRK